MSQRIPAHQLDTVFIQNFAQFGLCKVRMSLHLDELGNDLPFGLKLLDVLSFEIGDADALCLAFLIGFFQLAISCEPVSCRLMNIQEIHIL